jgi:hypothetical protein
VRPPEQVARVQLACERCQVRTDAALSRRNALPAVSCTRCRLPVGARFRADVVHENNAAAGECCRRPHRPSCEDFAHSWAPKSCVASLLSREAFNWCAFTFCEHLSNLSGYFDLEGLGVSDLLSTNFWVLTNSLRLSTGSWVDSNCALPEGKGSGLRSLACAAMRRSSRLSTLCTSQAPEEGVRECYCEAIGNENDAPSQRASISRCINIGDGSFSCCDESWHPQPGDSFLSSGFIFDLVVG